MCIQVRNHNFYLDINDTYKIAFLSDAKTSDIGDVSQRKALIKELKCHSFQWYLDHVYPDSAFPHNQLYSGQVC